MSRKFTNTKEAVNKGQQLARHREVNFAICFSLKLQNGYTFKEMKQNNLRDLHTFISNSVGRTWDEVDKKYKRSTDSNGGYDFEGENHQVYHYGPDNSPFRIHGILLEGFLHVLRIDCKHQYHK